MNLPSHRERREMNSPIRHGERRRVCPPVRAALLTAFAVGFGCAAAEAQDAQKEPPPELHMSLKGNLDNHEGWQLVGPAAAECVHFEPEGMRIALPPNHPGERANTGLKIKTAAKGDFEITVTFEILKEPDEAEAGKRATTLKMIAYLNSPHKYLAGISRRMAPGEGPQFTAWLNYNNPQAKKPLALIRTFATDAMKGRLRLVRTGAVIAHYVAKDTVAEFTFLHQFPFADDDLQAISLVASTGGSQAAFDVRLTDLRIRSSIKSLSEADPALLPRERPWQRWRLLLFLLLLGVALSAGCISWRLRRRRQAANSPDS